DKAARVLIAVKVVSSLEKRHWQGECSRDFLEGDAFVRRSLDFSRRDFTLSETFFREADCKGKPYLTLVKKGRFKVGQRLLVRADEPARELDLKVSHASAVALSETIAQEFNERANCG